MRPAWDAFFERFSPTILVGLSDGLTYKDFPSRSRFEDTLRDLHLEIVERFWREDLLEKCRNPGGIRAWIYTVSRHHAIDWVKAQKRTIRLPEVDAERATRSLGAPITMGSDLSLEDTLPAPDAEESERLEALRRFLENALDRMGRISNPRIRWVVRLCLQHACPLSPAEIQALARFCGLPRLEARKRIDEMIDALEKKESAVAESRERAIELWCEMGQIEKEIAWLERNPLAGPDELLAQREKLAAKSRTRDSHLEEAEKFPRPSNACIAALVGVPEDQAQYVSQMLLRGLAITRKQLASEYALIAEGRNG